MMDNQITVSQLKIEATQKQIVQLTADIQVTTLKIGQLDTSLNDMAVVLINRIAATYKTAKKPFWSFLLGVKDMENYLLNLTYLRVMQVKDKQLMVAAQSVQNDFQAEKQNLETEKQKQSDLQKQLVVQTAALNKQEANKKDLLAQTQGSEANYQKLLAAAEAQLAGFQKFVNGQGGASLLSNQTVCDDWGCYYNQRDSKWGGLPLNNTKYSLASDGCLLTDVAMIFTHYGHKNVTPVEIDSNPDNFASYEPAYLNKTVVADGATVNRIDMATSIIDGELSAGRPVIVGISYYGGKYPDHFVTLISGSGGNYKMNDPYLENGHNVPFNDHYKVSSIREVNKVVMQ